MNTPPESVRAWARRLLAVERASQPASDADVNLVLRICEKLRISLTQFAGADGFTALLRRALALARTDVPSLRTVKVTADCSLEGIEELAADGEKNIEAATAILEHLLGLLVVFIGESLTLRLVREAWPDASFDEYL